MNEPALCLYVQHLMGIGHQRRMAAIARACVARGFAVTYVSGGMPVAELDTDGCDVVQLPPCRSPDLRFAELVDANGAVVTDAWREQRITLLLQAWRSRSHSALLTETYPFGRKLMQFELLPLVDVARADGALIVSSVRDIVEHRPKLNKYTRMADAVLRSYDAVLVHSDPNVMPFDESFPAIGMIHQRLHYSGYVDEHNLPIDQATKAKLGRQSAVQLGGVKAALEYPTTPTDGYGEVIVSAGGGAYGLHLLEAALAAAQLPGGADYRWRILVGENVPERSFTELLRGAPEHVIVEHARQDFRALLVRACASISQGGYNTTMDVLATGVRAVVVAYHDETEREQLIRGRVLQRLGLLRMLPNAELTPAALLVALRDAITLPPKEIQLQRDGARISADRLWQWVEAGTCQCES